MASGKKEEERAARGGTLLQFMEKEENRRPQHFLFSFEMKGESERDKKKPYLDTLDALILCDLL